MDKKTKKKIKDLLEFLQCTSLQYVAVANNEDNEDPYWHFVVANDTTTETITKLQEELAHLLEAKVKIYTQESLETAANHLKGTLLGIHINMI